MVLRLFVVYVVEVVLIAMDQRLTAAIAHELSSRYCPANKPAFLTELLVLVGVFCAIGAALIIRGNNARLAGVLLALFAAGLAALDLFGFFGCGP